MMRRSTHGRPERIPTGGEIVSEGVSVAKNRSGALDTAEETFDPVPARPDNERRFRPPRTKALRRIHSWR